MDLADIRAAAALLEGRVHRTPVLTSRTLDDLASARLFLKAEHLQRTGSFKLRGATHAMLRADLSKGVAAFSSGNHAQAVACAARDLGTSAVIVMPSDAPAVKLAAVRGYGAEVVPYDRYAEDREAITAALIEKTGRVLIPPYDSLDIIAGQGTAGLELAEDAGPLDVLVVPGSGGGLASGCATAVRALNPAVRVILVEPAAGDDIKRSLESGERVRIPQPATIADGLAGQIPGTVTFPLLQRLVDEAVTVTDDQLVATMLLVFERLKQVVEPSGCAALAAVVHRAFAFAPAARIGVLLSGGNLGAARFAELTAPPGSPSRHDAQPPT